MEQAPKSFMAENTVFLLLAALIHNFYKTIMSRLDTKYLLFYALGYALQYIVKYLRSVGLADEVALKL